jgi:hypothetical protein
MSYRPARISPLDGPHVGMSFDGVIDDSDVDSPLAAYMGFVSNQYVPCISRRFSFQLFD